MMGGLWRVWYGLIEKGTKQKTEALRLNVRILTLLKKTAEALAILR